MKVLHLISSKGFYGAERMLITLARHQEAAGCAVTVGVFCRRHRAIPDVARRAQAIGLRVDLIPCGGRFSWAAVKTIRRHIADGAADIVHAHGYKTNLHALLAVSPHRRVALVSTVHGRNLDTLRMRAYTKLDTRVLRKCDRVVAVSHTIGQALFCAGIQPDLVRIVPNGVDSGSRTMTGPTLSGHLHRPAIGIVGRLIPAKGGAVLLRSAKEVLARAPGVTFYFFGEGPCRTGWEALAGGLGIADRVVFAGPRSDMDGVYASIDALVLPSFAEGLPMSVLEAFSAGVPVIATAVGSVPELVITSRTGLLVPPGDVRALADAILELLAHPARARAWGDNGRALVRAQYSAALMARRYIETYQEAISRVQPDVKKAMSATASQSL